MSVRTEVPGRADITVVFDADSEQSDNARTDAAGRAPPTTPAPPPSVSVSAPLRLVVFSDDWGRHPSSCQHLVGHLLDRYSTLWVNTIGTRPPKLSREDLGKGFVKLRQWMGLAADAGAGGTTSGGTTSGGTTSGGGSPRHLSIVSPPMYPGFRHRWQRRLNASLLARKVHTVLGPRPAQERRVAVTTIPVTADLVGRLDVDRWVYYCVDDFSVWPGLDGTVLDRMERSLVGSVDQVVCVSEALRDRVASLGRDSELLTHGIDVEHWQQPRSMPNASELPEWSSGLKRPVYLFWGVVDRRLDFAFCEALATRCGSLALVGPPQSPDERLRHLARLCMPGPVPYAHLPALAAAADVLVMPYADLPVTRALQPLKFKEYLATGKPVIVRKLPATTAWEDAADMVETVEQLVSVAAQRASEGTPASQVAARERLTSESWAGKARRFEAALLGA